MLVLFFFVDYFNSEKYTGEILISAYFVGAEITDDSRQIEIILRDNKTFTIAFSSYNNICKETGTYKFSNDTLKLFDKQKECTNGFEYNRFKFDSKKERLYVIHRNDMLDSSTYFMTK